MRSVANFRLSECQPRPGFGSGPASVWAFRHQLWEHTRLMHLMPSLAEGMTGESPVTWLILRASAKFSTAIRNVRSHAIVRLPAGSPERPALPVLRAWMKRSQSVAKAEGATVPQISPPRRSRSSGL